MHFLSGKHSRGIVSERARRLVVLSMPLSAVWPFRHRPWTLVEQTS
jgi:hypothetical protein